MAELTCQTAPGVTFPDRVSLQEHYRSDWHRYNLKRKVAGLPPLNHAQFEARKAAAQAAHAQGQGSAKQDHVKPSKKEKVARRRQRQESGSETSSLSSVQPPPPPPSGFVRRGAAAAEASEEEWETEEELDEEEAAEAAQVQETDVTTSLFDNHKSADLDAALAYMQKTYGFFIPDPEYIADLEGLVEYLHQKVRLGRCCLFCERTFRTVAGVQRHMVDKAHAKIRYEDQADMDELSDWYDFTGSYDETAAGPQFAEGEDAGDVEDVPEEIFQGRSVPDVEVLPSGELLISRNGVTKRIGVRWLRRYYDQNARAIEERESVLAAQRERLLLMYRAAGLQAPSDAALHQLATTGDARQQQRALMKVTQQAERRFVGAELVVARRHFRKVHNQRMKLGMNQNWLTKHQTAKHKNMGEGVGVHG